MSNDRFNALAGIIGRVAERSIALPDSDNEGGLIIACVLDGVVVNLEQDKPQGGGVISLNRADVLALMVFLQEVYGSDKSN